MSGWQIAIIVIIVLFFLLEMKNRRERLVYRQLEEMSAELLEGRFRRNPVQRRRFMRALARFAYTKNGVKLAYALARSTMDRCAAAEDKVACLMLCAFCLEEMGQAQKALETYEIVRKMEPDFLLCMDRRAHLLSSMEHYAAIEAYEEILARKPQDCRQRNNYASALIRMRQYEEAVEQLQILLEMDENFSTAYGLLALAHARMGNREEMEAALNAAAAHGQDTEPLRRIIKEDMEVQGNCKEE
ncbi:MAG: tetratricopeptide repeat protein [Clostridia bacterium]|nr:tetratricopeptide repeat protein [Clostridia bacterium]